MIEYYLGLPGSGKTYRAVDHAYNCFLDEKSKTFGKYDRFYTNINEFKFDSFNTSIDNQFAKVSASNISKPDSKIESGKREFITNESALASVKTVAYNLDMDALLVSLGELRDLYLSKVGDSVMMERADELELSNTLFIIDEAHNYFDAKNDVLVWWLSYHRHLHQDIILITQNLALIYRKYLTFGEFFYRAVPSSLRLRGGIFTYHQFVNYKLYKTSHTDTIKVKFNQKVYDLYGSGANTQGKKVIYKFIAIAIVLMIIVALFFNFVSSFLGDGSSSDNNQIKIQTLPTSLGAVIDRSSSFTVVCVGFDCSCFGQTFSLSDLNSHIGKYALHGIESTVVSDGVVLRTFARNDQFLKEVLNVSPDSSSGN
ncbi:MAG: zonular occludens toxin domain-containing protein [Sulfuricurvum sp.]|nr:zonular occludens toxin domain-containing protein [Sulfuricurvum sp.]